MVLQRINGNWAHCLKHLGKLKLATAKQGIEDRIARGIKDREHFERGAWFSENFNVVNERILGARAEYNPLIKYAEQATNAHKSANEFYLTDEIVDSNNIPYAKLLEQIAEQDAKKPIEEKRVIGLGKVKTHNVPTDSFADDDAIVWLAQGKELAHQYGKEFLLGKLGFKEVTVYHAPISKQNYTRGFWLCRLGWVGWSDFDCDGILGYGDGDVFGVSDSGEARTYEN